jgi:hypothetical protein
MGPFSDIVIALFASIVKLEGEKIREGTLAVWKGERTNSPELFVLSLPADRRLEGLRLRRSLKLEFQVELHTSRGLSGDRAPIKRRADHSNIRDVVFMIQDVEGVDPQRSGWPFLPGFGQHDTM